MRKENIENLKFITLNKTHISQMAELYKRSFAGEPWNDDWSDEKQLLEYMAEISGGCHALNFGLVMDGELVALSVGEIRHWWEGTNYNVEEFCVDPKIQGQGIGSSFMKMIEVEVKERGLAGIFLQTDSDKPAFSFYHKNGFFNLDTHVSLYKNLRTKYKILETERLILRPWRESDAEDLFRYASDPEVGPIAGWPPHQSVSESQDIIKTVLNGEECYAICLKEEGKAIGAIELKLNGHTDMTERDDECELGYWLGKPFWGQGIMPEAAREVIRHGFEEAGMTKIWCGYYEGNNKSKRVQEKVGFIYQWKSENVEVPLMNEARTGHVSCMTKEEWLRLQGNVSQNGNYTYKKATIEDIDELVRTRIVVLRAANKLLEDVDMSQVEQESRTYYTKALLSREHIAYLVYDNEKIIGTGGVSFYQVMPTYHNPTGKKAYIMNMYTAPDYRRQGIAFHTLDLLVKDAKEQGVSQIGLEATDMGVSLYDKYGFKKLKNEMEL